MAKDLLGGLSKDKRGSLQRKHQRALQYTTYENAFSTTRHCYANKPTLQQQVRSTLPSSKSTTVEIDETFFPFAHPGFNDTPAFAVVEIKAGGGDLQNAQMQAAVVGGAILLKARQIGAAADVVPYVPAMVAIGSTWYLHLIYDESGLVVTSTPWIISDTVIFLGTLNVVLFIEQLRAYAKDIWWKTFVDGSCSDLLERCLRV
ncbi:hypothetical protein TWF173_000870 [Orbilia oligospora]|nr:hypothetical protein TWF173_000870 [Orbilia oligospora]